MKYLKIMASIIGFLALTACGGGSSSRTTSAASDTVTGVATAAQVSVVTAN